MKILSVNNTADQYGAARCMERLFGRFAEDGHEVHIVLPEDGPIVKLLEQRGVQVHIHPLLSILDRAQVNSLAKCLRFVLLFPVSVLRLVFLILACEIDVVHTNTVVLPSSGVAAMLTGRPHVWHIRELLGEFGALWTPYQRIITFFSTAIVAISDCVREQFEASIRSKIKVIYDGLDDTAGNVNASNKTAFRSLFPPEKLLIGVVGRIKWHRKGQEVLVQAAAMLRAEYPEVRYVVVGSTSPGNESHEVRLRQLISDCDLDDQFTLLGETDDPIALFAALDIAVVPSVQAEPFGCVVLEAMSTGTPVVGSRCGGIAEQIVDGQSGILFEPGNSAELAAAIRRMLADPDLRIRMSREGVSRVQQAFPFSATYCSMAALFNQITGAATNGSYEAIQPSSPRI